MYVSDVSFISLQRSRGVSVPPSMGRWTARSARAMSPVDDLWYTDSYRSPVHTHNFYGKSTHRFIQKSSTHTSFLWRKRGLFQSPFNYLPNSIVTSTQSKFQRKIHAKQHQNNRKALSLYRRRRLVVKFTT